MRPRLLPATIVVGALLLLTKVAGLGLAFLPDGADLSSSMLGHALAAPAAEPAHEGPAPKPPAEAKPTSEAKPGTAPEPPTKAQAAVAGAPIPPAAPSSPPPVPVSEAERQLLQDLRGRRQELDAKERVLAQREGVLDAAEQRLSARVSQLTALQARLEQLETERHAREETNWTGLVKVYETMKPREAAAIFNDMDMPVLLQVMDRMKDAKTAVVLGAMQPERARQVTAQLAAMRTHATTLAPDKPGPG
jgi:flagellar motility protein MotE (MotC chaperone)